MNPFDIFNSLSNLCFDRKIGIFNHPDLKFVATAATGGREKFLSPVQIFPENMQFLTYFASLHTPKCELSSKLLKNLHILFNFYQKRAKLLLMMHFFCWLLAKIVSIYAFSVCFCPKIGSCKFFDKFEVCNHLFDLMFNF